VAGTFPPKVPATFSAVARRFPARILTPAGACQDHLAYFLTVFRNTSSIEVTVAQLYLPPPLITTDSWRL
jgi:hypothetical protein